MASKRRLRRRACERKRDYPDQTTATAAARSLRRATGEHVHAYRCQHCAAWHVGHPPKRVRQAIRDRRRAGQ